MNNVIEIKNLIKKYSSGFQLGDLSFSIPKGMIIGLIGENGAGKTTLIKLILGIIKRNNGIIKIFDKDLDCNEKEIKEDIGVVLDDMFFPEVINADDINDVMKDIYKNWDSELYYKYLNDFNLPKKKNLKTLSKGMKKKLEIITALSHKPKLLILDEPTSGLDPVVRNEILDLFLDFMQDENNTILLSTHITTDLEHIADRIIFVDNGKAILNESKDDIMNNYAILKCDFDYFNELDIDDIICYKQNKFGYDVLIDNKNKLRKKYNDCVIDNITLDDLMLMLIKGDK